MVGPKPQKAVGLKDYPKCDAEVKKLADEIWGDCDGKTHTEHVYGQGRVFHHCFGHDLVGETWELKL